MNPEGPALPVACGAVAFSYFVGTTKMTSSTMTGSGSSATGLASSVLSSTGAGTAGTPVASGSSPSGRSVVVASSFSAGVSLVESLSSMADGAAVPVTVTVESAMVSVTVTGAGQSSAPSAPSAPSAGVLLSVGTSLSEPDGVSGQDSPSGQAGLEPSGEASESEAVGSAGTVTVRVEVVVEERVVVCSGMTGAMTVTVSGLLS